MSAEGVPSVDRDLDPRNQAGPGFENSANVEGSTLSCHSRTEVGAHFPLHLVDLPKRGHTLTDYAPGFVRISVVTNSL